MNVPSHSMLVEPFAAVGSTVVGLADAAGAEAVDGSGGPDLVTAIVVPTRTTVRTPMTAAATKIQVVPEPPGSFGKVATARASDWLGRSVMVVFAPRGAGVDAHSAELAGASGHEVGI